MDIPELNRAFNCLKPGKIVSSANITRGLANISYLVTTDSDEKYVIRQLHDQTAHNARVESTIQKELKKNHIQVPVYLSLRNGDVVGEKSGYSFTISAFFEGTGPSKRSFKLARSYGKTLALIHDALDPKHIKIHPNPAQWLSFDVASKNITSCTGRLHDTLTEQLSHSKHILGLDLPLAIIHGDLMEDNVFAEHDEIVAVFDFETAQYGIRILDIARSYLSLGYRGELHPEKLKDSLFQGYDSVARHALTEEETKHFPLALTYVATACAAWLANNGGNEFVQPFLDAAKVNTSLS